MLICWLIGHRLDYDIRKSDLIALACKRCGCMRILYQVTLDPKLTPYQVEEKKP